MIFCDTSTVAKFYLSEPESASVRGLFDSVDEICISELARVELASVFHRRWREGKWSHLQFLAVSRQFSTDDARRLWTWLPVDRNVVDAAASLFAGLPDTVFLRSSDCIHLATALRHGFDTVYTYDAHQAQSASAVGLAAAIA